MQNLGWKELPAKVRWQRERERDLAVVRLFRLFKGKPPFWGVLLLF